MASRELVGACPGCGAEISFRAADSVLAVCEYCSTTSVRQGGSLARVGKMADLFDDHSPLSLGTVGVFEGRSFELVGRLQNRYSQGVWNEWRLVFDDGSVAWLSEDNASYTLSSEQAPTPAPDFEQLKIGQELTFADTVFRVTYKESATVIAGAGELPFVVGSGYKADVIDLRSADGKIATLDYSDRVTEPEQGGSQSSQASAAGPILYLGRAVQLPDLSLQGLTEATVKRVALEAFSCPQCGATVNPVFSDSKSLTCGSCASLLDVSQGLGEQIRVHQQSPPPKLILPIGGHGRLDSQDWVVVGFTSYEGNDGEERFGWHEYLLHNSELGFRFLTCDTGHWALGQIVQKSISTADDRFSRGVVRFDGRRYDQYAQYEATVRYVMGEFFWRISQADKSLITDYISSPYALSSERTESEIVWSQAQHIDHAELCAAFKLEADEVPAPTGVGMLAPLPPSDQARYLKLAAVAAVCLIAVQLIFSMMGVNAELVSSQSLPQGQESKVHQVELSGSRASNLEVSVDSDVWNDYFGVQADLSSKDGAVVQGLASEVGYYSGTSGGESWSEGSRDGRLVFPGLQPGMYTVTISVESSKPGKQIPMVHYQIIQQGRPLLLPFLIGLGAVIGLAVLSWLLSPNHLRRRWSNSQYGSPPNHPQMWGSEDDDD